MSPATSFVTTLFQHIDDGITTKHDSISEKALMVGDYAFRNFVCLYHSINKRKDLIPGQMVHVSFLDPTYHLVAKTWNAFGMFVRQHHGWNVKRHVISKDHKQQLGITRKPKAYQMIITYRVASYGNTFSNIFREQQAETLTRRYPLTIFPKNLLCEKEEILVQSHQHT